MRKIILFTTLLISAVTASFAQGNVSINTDGSPASPSAMLDVKSTDKGMLVPRMTSAQRAAILLPATGLLVFDISTGSFWFYSGTAWANLGGQTVVADADGNTKIQVEKNPNEDIIRFDLGGTEKMVLRKNPAGSPNLDLPDFYQNIFIGDNVGSSNTVGYWNTATGVSAFRFNTSGYSNSATGYQALTANISGFGNTANGANALYINASGNNNTAIGNEALYVNATGNSNVAIGVRALNLNTDRSNLVAVGDSALYNNGTGASQSIYGTDNTAVGSKSLFSTLLDTTILPMVFMRFIQIPAVP